MGNVQNQKVSILSNFEGYVSCAVMRAMRLVDKYGYAVCTDKFLMTFGQFPTSRLFIF